MSEVINNSMANNYTGIIFDNLKKTKPTLPKKEEPVPEWFGKEIKEDKLSAEEVAKLKESLKKFS